MPTKPTPLLAKIEEVLNSKIGNALMLSIIVALLGGIGLDVSDLLPAHPHPECAPCPACPAQPAVQPPAAPVVAPVAEPAPEPVEVAPAP